MDMNSVLISIIVASVFVVVIIQLRKLYVREYTENETPADTFESFDDTPVEPPAAQVDLILPVPEPEPEETVTGEVTKTVHITTSVNYPTVESLDPDTSEMINAGISCIPKLPGVTLEVLPILAKTGSGAKEIAEIINRDQPMAARLLRWVNSSFYGLENKVISVHRAVALLGTDSVRSLVLEDSFGRLENVYDIDGLKLETVWRHAAAVSCIARHLAKQIRRIEPSIAATAGLLHDIGLLIMLIVGKKSLEKAVASAREANEPMIAHEFEILGANHQIYGELFVEAWNLPDEIKHAVGRHHNPLMEPFNNIVAMIWLSDYLTSRLGFACPYHQVPVCDDEEVNHIMTLIGLRPPLGNYMTESLARDLVNATRLFGGKGVETADTTS